MLVNPDLSPFIPPSEHCGQPLLTWSSPRMSFYVCFHLSRMPEVCTLFEVLPSSDNWVLCVSPWCTGNSCQTAGQRHLQRPVCYVKCLDVVADHQATDSAFGIGTKILAAGRYLCPQRQSLSVLVVDFLLN